MSADNSDHVDGWLPFATTVGELRAKLADLSDDLPVILEKDAEGNGYSPLSSVLTGWYEPDSTYSGDAFGDDDVTPSDELTGVGRDEDLHVLSWNAVRCLVLGPVN